MVFTTTQNDRDNTVYTTADSEYDTCSIKTIPGDPFEKNKFQVDTIEDDYNLYEKPLPKNLRK